jgi:hypothetical protein
VWFQKVGIPLNIKFNLGQMFKYGLLANDDKMSYLIGVFLQKVMAVTEG